MQNKFRFPLGFYTGSLEDNNGNEMPLIFPESCGGFCLLYEGAEKTEVPSFIENSLLSIVENLSSEAVEINVFDYSIKNKFTTLSKLKSDGLYKVYQNSQDANLRFSEFESIAFKRHHEILGDVSSIAEYNTTSKYKEKYYLVVLNLDDFPDEYSNSKRLVEFFDASYEAGFYVIAFANKKLSAEGSDIQNTIINNLPIIEITKKGLNIQPQPMLEPLFKMIEKHDLKVKKFEDKKDNFFDNIQENISNALTGNSETNFLTIPIGTSIDGRTPINFTLGAASDNYSAFITGLPGSGKSTLLHSLIVGIAEKYTSKEIRLFLMDYKEGNEFQIYKKHPNCEKIFLDNKDLMAATHLLENFVQTIEERGEQFRLAETKDISTYNQKNPNIPLPRIILIIDEVQRLFAGEWGNREHLSQLLKDVVRRGRAFGVHIILSTQTLAGTDIDKELMSQITLRISFKLAQHQDAEGIFGYGNHAPLELSKYQLIYNNKSGQKDANLLCRTTELKDIKETIKQINLKREPSLILVPEIVQSNEEKPTTVPEQVKEVISNVRETTNGKKIIDEEADFLAQFVKNNNATNPLEESE